MKNLPLTALALVSFSLLVIGCAPAEQAAPPASATPGAAATTAVVTGQPKGSLQVGGRAVCAVCSVKEGTKEPEEVKAVLDYKDKSYGFCNESEKAEFISDPTKYAQAK